MFDELYSKTIGWQTNNKTLNVLIKSTWASSNNDSSQDIESLQLVLLDLLKVSLWSLIPKVIHMSIIGWWLPWLGKANLEFDTKNYQNKSGNEMTAKVIWLKAYSKNGSTNSKLVGIFWMYTSSFKAVTGLMGFSSFRTSFWFML